MRGRRSPLPRRRASKLSNSFLVTALWSAVLVHLAAGIAVYRQHLEIGALAWLNLTVLLLVVGYWVVKWYSYVFQGITWYLTDQAVPAYAVLALGLVALHFVDRGPPGWVLWGFAIAHGLILLAAALCFSTFRLDRLF